MQDKAGGWGEKNDEQYHCPSCGKRCCGAELSKAQLAKSKAEGHRKSCKVESCHRAAGWGTTHSGFGRCKFHFGATDAVSQSAFRQEARSMMRSYGVPVEIDAEDALAEEIHRTVGHVRWLAEKVASLGEADPATDADDGPLAINGSAAPRSARVLDVDGDGNVKRQTKGRKDEDGEDDGSGEVYSERLTPTGDDALVFGVVEREVQAGGEGGGFDRIKVAAAPNVWLQVYMAERKHLADVTKIAIAANLQTRRLNWAETVADQLIGAMEDLAAQLGHDPHDPKIRLITATTLESLVGGAKAS